jgi:CBS domain-containing protein
MKQVREVMTASPAFATPETSVRDVARMMEENDCGAIPVMEGGPTGRALGMVTDRDITIRAVAKGRNPLDMRVSELMSGPPITVRAEDDVEDAAELMGRNQVRRLIVVDSRGVVCGILAQADVAQHAGKRDTGKMVQEVSEPAGVTR